MALDDMMHTPSFPVPHQPTRLLINNIKRRAGDDDLLSAPSSPIKKSVLQHPQESGIMGVPNMMSALSLSVFQHLQETEAILPLPAKATIFDFGKLPTELVVTVMEQTADLPTLINLIFASDAARQAFIKYPKAFMPHLIPNEHVLNLFLAIFTAPTNQKFEPVSSRAITERLVRAVCVIRSTGTNRKLDAHEFLRRALDPTLSMDGSKYPITHNAAISVAMTLVYAIQNDCFCLEDQQNKKIIYECWSWQHKFAEDRRDRLTAELFDNAFWMFQLFQDVVLYRTELEPWNKYIKDKDHCPSRPSIIPEIIDEIIDDWELEAGKTWRDVLALRNEIYVRFVVVKRRVNKFRIAVEQVRLGTTFTPKQKMKFAAIDLPRVQGGLGLGRVYSSIDDHDYWWFAGKIRGSDTVTRSERWHNKTRRNGPMRSWNYSHAMD